MDHSPPHLSQYGIDRACDFYNLSYEELMSHERENKEGLFTKDGVFVVNTGQFSGRSPKDRWIVQHPDSENHIWWGENNQKISPEAFDRLYTQVCNFFSKNTSYVFDGYGGASPTSRKHVRVITNLAWQHHFAKNMFIETSTRYELSEQTPDFTIINACKITDEKWKENGLNSNNFVIFNIEKKIALIGGTWYSGEMKKGIFSMMNYWLPLSGTLSMHCSANKSSNGTSCLFFGLSGTGKTTLSADPARALIGDDEHGWDDHGIFNIEGGCYAKTINLDPLKEPDIYKAIKPNALLENVVMDKGGNVDFADISNTENTRVSYPINHIKNIETSLQGPHPQHIIFLTCDAYGVLPPISELTPEQAMYHFLSGYTAKVGGTERHIREPKATFSACFGAAFMTLHPIVYARLLGEKIKKHNIRAYLVNTGWTGGGYNVGKRMDILISRACVQAILDDSIKAANFKPHPIFRVSVPDHVKGVPENFINPENTWKDADAYKRSALSLSQKFISNFQGFRAQFRALGFDEERCGPTTTSS